MTDRREGYSEGNGRQWVRNSSQQSPHRPRNQQQQQPPPEQYSSRQQSEQNGQQGAWPRQQQLPHEKESLRKQPHDQWHNRSRPSPDDPGPDRRPQRAWQQNNNEQRRQAPNGQQQQPQPQQRQQQPPQQQQQKQQPRPFKPPPPRTNAWNRAPEQQPQPSGPGNDQKTTQQQTHQEQAPAAVTPAPVVTLAVAASEPHGQGPLGGSMGAWTTKLAHKSSNKNAHPSSSPRPVVVLKKSPTASTSPPPSKKPQNKHAGKKQDNKNSSSNNNINTKIHGKKPKLNSISMGDLVPSIKKILPKDQNNKRNANANTKSAPSSTLSGGSQARPFNAGSEPDFPALPSTSNWPSLAAAKPTPAQPKRTTPTPPARAKISTPPKQAKSNNNNNNNSGNSSKKRNNQSQQQLLESKKGNSRTTRNNTTNTTTHSNSSNMIKVDENHLQAQLFLPPGRTANATMDQNHMQSQFNPLLMGKAMGGGNEHDLMMRMMQDGQVVRGRQRIKPRKKRFTALKRKILFGRLRAWKEMHPEEDDGKDVANSNCEKNGLSASTTVCVYGFLSLEELEDADEFEELLENLKDMAEKIGTVTHIFIPRAPLEEDDNMAERDHPAFVEFSAPGEAMAARGVWNELVIGGHPLKVDLLKVASDNTSNEERWQQLCLEAEKRRDDEMLDVSDSATCRILLKDVLTEDDLEDDDCFTESIQDIKILVEKFGTVEDIRAKKQEGNRDVLIIYKGGPDVANSVLEGLQTLTLGGSRIVAQLVSDQDASSPQAEMKLVLENVLSEDDLEDEECLEESLQDVRSLLEEHGSVASLNVTGGTIVVEFDGMTPDTLRTVVSKLNGVCLGGQTVKASSFVENITSCDMPYVVVLRNLLTQDDLDDNDCLEESLEDVRELARQHGNVVDIQVEKSDDVASSLVKIAYATSSEAEKAAKEFEGMIIGGETVSASMKVSLSDPSWRHSDTNVDAGIQSAGQENSLTGQDEEPKEMFSGDKRIPERFAACKRVPKVPNKGTPRNYAIFTNNDTVKSLLSEMLGELMRLQLRALHDKNVKNAKARRRVVVGLREVARGIRANKVKMVVMANNLDEYGAIDDKLQEILDLAAEKELPVLFELSKRVLGKAVGKKIKVSVVGIQGTDGAHQHFVKLAGLAPHLIKPSSLVEEHSP